MKKVIVNSTSLYRFIEDLLNHFGDFDAECEVELSLKDKKLQFNISNMYLDVEPQKPGWTIELRVFELHRLSLILKHLSMQPITIDFQDPHNSWITIKEIII